MTNTDSPQPEAQEEQEQKAFPKRAFALVFLGVAVCAAGYVYLRSVPTAVPPGNSEALAVMDAKLQNLDKTVSLYGERINKLEEEVKTLAQAKNQPAAPLEAGKTDSGKIGPAMPESPASAAPLAMDGKRLESLEKELATLKTSASFRDGQHAAHAIALLSAYHRLSDKVLSGRTFADALSDFQNVAGENAAQAKLLSQLAPYAENGVPTLAELLTSFDNASEQFVSSQVAPAADAGAWDRLMFNLTHLVRIQRIDTAQTGKDAGAVIGRAAAHLDAGEIEAAYAEINTLPEEARASFASWLEDAQMAIDAPGIIEQIEEMVMQDVFKASAESRDTEEGAGVP